MLDWIVARLRELLSVGRNGSSMVLNLKIGIIRPNMRLLIGMVVVILLLGSHKLLLLLKHGHVSLA